MDGALIAQLPDASCCTHKQLRLLDGRVPLAHQADRLSVRSTNPNPNPNQKWLGLSLKGRPRSKVSSPLDYLPMGS